MVADPVSIWIIKQLGSFAAKPAGKYLSRAILGDPVERALGVAVATERIWSSSSPWRPVDDRQPGGWRSPSRRPP